jgi:hypothetical protein
LGYIRVNPGLRFENAGFDLTGLQYQGVYPADLWLEIGQLDGIYEWNYTGELIGTQTIDNLTSAVNSAIDNCVPDIYNKCHIPIILYSSSRGSVRINMEGNLLYYDAGEVRIEVDSDILQTYLNTKDNVTTIPITFSSDTQGNIEISDISYVFVGDTATINHSVRNHLNTYNDYLNVTYYYSGWIFDYPSGISRVDFYPPTPTSENVAPFGQTEATPIYNITYVGYGYSSLRANFSVYQDLEMDCVVVRVGNNTESIPPNEWYYIQNNLTYLDNFGIWLYANYSCAPLDWQLIKPGIYMRACCDDCLCGEELN